MKQGNAKAGTAVPPVKLTYSQRKARAAVRAQIKEMSKRVLDLYNRPDIVKERLKMEKKSQAKERQKLKELKQLIRDEIKAVVTSRTFIRALKQSLKA